ncbi:MAG: hypothetical protein E7620_02095 [Ruminococcaceae bacterium]|nr:hypothetical protein [Oscillospiraceae bacterium]
MKKIRLLIVFSFVLCCLLGLSACESLEALKTPERLTVEDTTLTLSWKEVKGAKLYTIQVLPEGQEEAQEYLSAKTSYSLASLKEGSYQIRVKANGKEDVNEDSVWSEFIPFIREREPGLVFTLINGNTAYEVTNEGIATGDIVIPATYRNKPVTSIGNKAFFNKSDVTSVKLGENITRIGSYAFANCSYLTSVELPAGLTYLGEHAFASCRLLAGKLVLPAGVEQIPESAFSYCGSLTEVVLGDRVTYIGKNAFTDCKGLTSVTLPDSLISVDEYAFALCNNLASLDLGQGLVSIGQYAFSGLPALQSVSLPNSLKTIGEGAFYSCAALSNVQISNTVEKISMGAFADTALWNQSATNEVYVGDWLLGLKDTTVTAVSFRENTYGIADYAFYRNSVLDQLRLPESLKRIGEASFAGTAITSVVIGRGVEEIGAQAFIGCSKLINAILGEYDFDAGELKDSSLRVIGDYAFRDCKALSSIQIPETVRTIGSYAFRDSGLPSVGGVIYADHWAVGYAEDEIEGAVALNSETVGIANYAFYNCSSMTSVVIPDSVKLLGRAAFYDCSGLVSVTMPDALEVLPDYVFYRCQRLIVPTLPPALKEIGRSAFYKCGSIYVDQSVDTDADVLVIPIGVEVIGDYAFYGCGERTENAGSVEIRGIDVVMMGDTVKQIGSNAFSGFVSLKRVEMGNGIEAIGEKAFYQCASLEEVTFGSGLKTIGTKAFYKCAALKSVALKNSVAEIGDYAFYKCTGLTELRLGESVERIGAYAFTGCVGLTELHVPASVKLIGKQAFRGCKALTNATLPAELEKVEIHAFYGCHALTLYVENATAPEGWVTHWNSSYRPVIWGCVLSEGKDYVLYLAKEQNSVSNRNASNTISDPTREGYIFQGWGANSTATTPAYTSANLKDADNGRRLYAIWREVED